VERRAEQKRVEHLRLAGYLWLWKPGHRPVGKAKGTVHNKTQLIRDAVALAADKIGNFLYSHETLSMWSRRSGGSGRPRGSGVLFAGMVVVRFDSAAETLSVPMRALAAV